MISGLKIMERVLVSVAKEAGAEAVEVFDDQTHVMSPTRIRVRFKDKVVELPFAALYEVAKKQARNLDNAHQLAEHVSGPYAYKFCKPLFDKPREAMRRAVLDALESEES